MESFRRTSAHVCRKRGRLVTVAAIGGSGALKASGVGGPSRAMFGTPESLGTFFLAWGRTSCSFWGRPHQFILRSQRLNEAWGELCHILLKAHQRLEIGCAGGACFRGVWDGKKTASGGTARPPPRSCRESKKRFLEPAPPKAARLSSVLGMVPWKEIILTLPISSCF